MTSRTDALSTRSQQALSLLLVVTCIVALFESGPARGQEETTRSIDEKLAEVYPTDALVTRLANRAKRNLELGRQEEAARGWSQAASLLFYKNQFFYSRVCATWAWETIREAEGPKELEFRYLIQRAKAELSVMGDDILSGENSAEAGRRHLEQIEAFYKKQGGAPKDVQVEILWLQALRYLHDGDYAKAGVWFARAAQQAEEPLSQRLILESMKVGFARERPATGSALRTLTESGIQLALFKSALVRDNFAVQSSVHFKQSLAGAVASLHRQGKDLDVLHCLWSAKGFTTEIEKDLQPILRSPEAKAVREQMTAARRRIADIVHDPQSDREEIDKLHLKVMQLNGRIFVLASEQKRLPQRSSKEEIQELAGALPDGTAIIDIARHLLWQLPDSGKGLLVHVPHYYATVIRKASDGQLFVKSIHLGDAETLDEAVSEFVDRLQAEAELSLKKVDLAESQSRGLDRVKKRNTPKAGDVLREQVWSKIQPHLAESTHLIFCPNGAFTRMPWAALSPDAEQPRSAVIDRYSLSVANCPRAVWRILKQPAPSEPPENCLTVAGIDYDGREYRSALLDFRPTALPASISEVNSLEAKFAELNGQAKIKSLRAGAASETNIRTALEQADIAHVAAHGFHYELSEAHDHDLSTPKHRRPGRPQISTLEALEINPFAACGLVVSNSADGDDGILTANELITLNLTKMRLLVLSACDSAVGNDYLADGAFSLQLAMEVSGVQSCLASVQQVQDRAAAQFMDHFYDHWLKHGRTRAEAVRRAQLAMKFAGAPRGLWASWTLFNDWR